MRNFRKSPELTAESAKYLLDVDGKDLHDHPESYDFSPEGLTGRSSKRTTLSLGVGSGEVEVELSQQSPDSFVLGIEATHRPIRIAATNAANANAENVMFVRGKAHEIMAQMGTESVDHVVVAFPPPISNTKDRRKDILCDQNLDEIMRITRSGGRVTIRTDDDKYFDEKTGKLIETSQFVEGQPADLPKSRFQKVWEKAGRTIKTATFIKK